MEGGEEAGNSSEQGAGEELSGQARAKADLRTLALQQGEDSFRGYWGKGSDGPDRFEIFRVTGL